ncbi:16S rRNA (guanine(966)-N(2))-methyltransferase RsmD [Lapillicoccus jejuensis]|uniref:16S rRNA (Guanine966-N2)-methyltransferase n=1 Tax=Lapillicoccus jejuensis TaxID=402171 RepID=A0A542E375_9MICO|nr:16S rRNA (guanine(966)-N(2))-methyltransferase RsmD [Lapillicoccus jejuensis]TQJ09788.1 16S rRNA (guanine966-N2)-methyltransferase [Lapillicoccus jejuensis]
MTRIISGRAGGHRLRTPAGSGTRPTSDRVREALFSRLDHLGVLDGAVVLDLYAGSGALGLEAASRGAVRVLLVESDRRAAGVARDNARALAAALAPARVDVRADTVERVLGAGPPPQPADLVLLDPPYDVPQDRLARVLALLLEPAWLAPGALVVVERSSRTPEPDWPAGLELVDERRHGETVLWTAEHVERIEPAGDGDGVA